MYSISEPVPVFWDPYVRRKFIKLGTINGGPRFLGQSLRVVCPVDPITRSSHRPWCLPVIADECECVGEISVRDFLGILNTVCARVRSIDEWSMGEVYKSALAHLEQWHSDQYSHMVEEYMALLVKRNAARIIQRRWRQVITDPSHAACRRRLLQEYHALAQVTGW